MRHEAKRGSRRVDKSSVDTLCMQCAYLTIYPGWYLGKYGTVRNNLGMVVIVSYLALALCTIPSRYLP